jgi:chromosome segregation ATPase
MRRYDYKGWARYRLSSQLDQVEDMWDKERRERVDTAHALSDEKRTHNDLQWQLREAEQRLSAQQGSFHDLQLDYEKAKNETEKAVEAVKQVKREKRELQMKISLLTEDIRRFELDASKARFEVAASVDQVQVLRREHLADADKASDFEHRELSFALDRLKDSEKRNKELQHTFNIERERYENRQKGIYFNLFSL